MDDEPVIRSNPPDSLDELSVEDLRRRIVELEREIARIRDHLARRDAHRSAAEAFFRKN